MNNYSDKIAITTGDPNGIGAEIVIESLNTLKLKSDKFVVISNEDVLKKNGNLRSDIEVINLPYNGEINEGKDTSSGGDFSFKQLEVACTLRPKRIVTAPVSKNAMHLAGHMFNGQTEVLEHFLAKNEEKAEMLFLCKDFRVLLLTRHIPLQEIRITKEMLRSKVIRLYNFFIWHTHIKSPKFALCALNPHAGENGIIGKEEVEILTPAVRELRMQGIDITNPFSADTLMAVALQTAVKNKKQPYDCYIAMYHDQGLIPVKAASIDETVNMTIGLDIIRTSPAHGTAYDIAGKGIASEKSMLSAIKTAMDL